MKQKEFLRLFIDKGAEVKNGTMIAFKKQLNLT